MNLIFAFIAPIYFGVNHDPYLATLLFALLTGIIHVIANNDLVALSRNQTYDNNSRGYKFAANALRVMIICTFIIVESIVYYITTLLV